MSATDSAPTTTTEYVRRIRSLLDYVGIESLPKFFETMARILKDELDLTAVDIWENCAFGDRVILRSHAGVTDEPSHLGMTLPRRKSLTGHAIRTMEVQDYGLLVPAADRRGVAVPSLPWDVDDVHLTSVPVGSHYNPHQILFCVNLVKKGAPIPPAVTACFVEGGMRETLGLAFDYVLYKADESIGEVVLSAWAESSSVTEFFGTVSRSIFHRVSCKSLHLYKVSSEAEPHEEATAFRETGADCAAAREVPRRTLVEHCVNERVHCSQWEDAGSDELRCVELAVPVPGEGNQVLGILRCSAAVGGPSLTSTDLHVLYCYASSIASPFSRMLERRRATQMEELLEQISYVIAQGEHLETTLSRVTDTIRRLLGVSRTSIYLLAQQEDQLRFAAGSGFPDLEAMRSAVYSPGEGITGTIFETRQPLVFRKYDEIKSHAQYSGKYDRVIWPEEAPAAFAGLPLEHEGNTLGVLKVSNIESSDRHPEAHFTVTDIRGLKTLATVLAAFVRSHQDRREAAATEHRKLSRGAIHIHSAESVQDAIHRALNALADSGYNESMISLVDDQGTYIRAAQARGERWNQIVTATVVHMEGDDILAHVLRTGKAEFIENSREDPRCHDERIAASGIESQYVIPLALGGEKIGTMQVAIEPPRRDLDEEQIAALDSFAQHLNSSIVRIRQAERLIQMSDQVLGKARFLIAETLAAKTVHSLGHQLDSLTVSAEKLLRNPTFRQRTEVREMIENWIQSFSDVKLDARRALDLLRRPEATTSGLTDVNHAIQEAIGMWYAVANTSQTRFHSPQTNAKKHHVRLRADGLMEILSVLIVNAIQANARQVWISTENVEDIVLDDKDYLPEAIVITVRDDGRGLTAEAKGNPETLFDPTFSTKRKDRGTGLGLFIARSLARTGEGDVEYAPDRLGSRGAAFTVILPVEEPDT